MAALLQAAARQQGRPAQTSFALAQLMTNYAFLLASQGSFSNALTYLESAHEVCKLFFNVINLNLSVGCWMF